MLPAAIQEFLLNAGDYLAGIDEMISATDRLADSIDAAMGGIVAAFREVSQVADSAGESFGAAAAASDEAMASMGDAMDEATAAAERAAGAQGAMSDAEKAAADMAAFEAELLADLAAQQGLLADGAKALTDGLAAEARAMKAVGDSAALAGEESAAAGGEMAAAGDEAETAGGKAATAGGMWKTALLGVAVALGYGIDQAAKYQSTMTQLLTQAGVAPSQFKYLSQGVLQLAGRVGFSPDSLAHSLYYVESSFQSLGITGPKALSLLTTGAKLAQIGHSNLEDTVKALDGLVASGISGVQNYSQAAGALLAITGSGELSMQDVVDSMGTGLMANAKLYRQSVQQVGAALADLGDAQIRGAKAGTDLRMTWQAILSPLATAKPLLASIGLGYTTLATTMEKHGLSASLGQFIAHLKSSHVPIGEWGQYVTDIFGKKAGSGIGVLISTYGRLMSKFPDMKHQMGSFGDDWKKQQQTLSQQFDNLKSGLGALAISFGTVLLPAATKVVGMLAKFAGVLEHHPALAAFAGGLVLLAGGLKIAATAESIFSAAFAEGGAGPIFLIIAAIAGLALGLYELYKHSKLVRDIVADVGRFFKAAWADAMKGADAVIKWFVSGPLAFIKQELGVFSKWWSQNGAEVREVASTVWKAVSDIVTTAWHLIWDIEIHPGLIIMQALWKAAWIVIRDTVKVVWDVIADTVRTDIRVILDIISVVLDILTGHWSKAWSDLKRLASDALRGCIQVIRTITGGFDTLLLSAGKAIVEGLINGIKDMAGAAGHAIENVASGVYHHALSFLGIGSPSKLFYYIGSMITQGLAGGITETMGVAVAKATALAAAVKQAYAKGQITAAEQTEFLGNIADDISARKDKLVSTMKKIGLEMGAGMLSSLENATSASTAKTAVDKLISYVQQAWSAGDISTAKASAMTTWLEADNSRLQDLAAQRQKIAATIKTAVSFANTTTSSTESWAGLSNVTSSMTSGGMVYSGNILAGMKADLGSINQFTAAIRKLGRMGLRKDLINQLIQMGPAQGLQVAQALLDGPAKVIAEMDATQAGIASGSTALGQAAANAMYDTGQSAGKGFLSGLQAQKGQLTSMMEELAKHMVATMKSELGVGGSLGKGGGGNVTVTVHGFIGSEQQLVDELYKAIQQESLRHAKRNGNNGLSL